MFRWFLASLLLGRVALGKNRPTDAFGTVDFEMVTHSFEAPMAAELVTEETSPWFIEGASIGTPKDRVILNPAVQNRIGVLFAREAVLSSDWRVEIALGVTGSVIKNQGFGVWVTDQDFAKQYKDKNPFRNFDKVEASFLCCNKVKPSSCKRSMIHANTSPPSLPRPSPPHPISPSPSPPSSSPPPSPSPLPPLPLSMIPA